MEMIKINKFAITQEGFKFKMDKAPDFFMIKIHEDKLVYDALGIYISKENIDRIGLDNFTEIVNDFNYMTSN
jgi:hypothetical protein